MSLGNIPHLCNNMPVLHNACESGESRAGAETTASIVRYHVLSLDLAVKLVHSRKRDFYLVFSMSVDDRWFHIHKQYM